MFEGSMSNWTAEDVLARDSRMAMPTLPHGKPIRQSRARGIAPKEERTARTMLRGRWRAMIARCHDPSHESYRNYGARGIHVCAEWRADFETFQAHVGPIPSTGMTIERIDNSKGYAPGNVKWASRSEQARNRRSNVSIVVDGERVIMADLAKRVGRGVKALSRRLRAGESLTEALKPPYIEVEYGGKLMSLRAAARLAGIPAPTVYHRHERGVPRERWFLAGRILS